jgi:integrase
MVMVASITHTQHEQLKEESQVYFNFINSLDSEYTKKMYRFCLEKFLSYHKLDLTTFLKLPEQDISDLVTRYMATQKISREYKNLMFSTLKHACEMNDVILNWKKLKKFIKKIVKTDNETNGRDRGYTHEEIQKILSFSDQRVRTVFLLLASNGTRAGILRSLKVRDLEKIDELQTYISPYYDASRYEMEQSIKDPKKDKSDNKQKESESISNV